MPQIVFRPGEKPVDVSPQALVRMASFAAQHCEAQSIVAQTLGDQELLKVVQNVHDTAERFYYRLTGENLPSTVVGPNNQGGRRVSPSAPEKQT